MRVLAIDYGSTRIGLALSDPTGTLARPLPFIPAKGDVKLARELAALAQKEQAERILLGLPRHMNGSLGDAAAKVQAFATALGVATKIPIQLVDERLTTVQASRQLQEAGKDIRAQRGRIDSEAAAVLLQGWLDARMKAPPGQPFPPHRYDASHQGHKLTIAYRGTDFFGWQRQAEKRTVQECLELALAKLWGHKIDLQGSGRTDTGVHALGQVASFNAHRLHTAPVLQRALNANLPRDVRVVKCRLVSPAFHARFDAVEKGYRYLVLNQIVVDPFTLDTHYHVPMPLDLPAMRRAAAVLLGEHDFASFTSNPGYERSRGTIRTLRRASITKSGHVLAFHFTSNGFLYRMVRNLVGGLVKVGLGKLSVHDFERILRAKSRSEAPPNAPAHGLYLVSVSYPRMLAKK